MSFLPLVIPAKAGIQGVNSTRNTGRKIPGKIQGLDFGGDPKGENATRES